MSLEPKAELVWLGNGRYAVVDFEDAHLADLKWYEIERAGHEPWKEEHGREAFWRIVREELE